QRYRELHVGVVAELAARHRDAEEIFRWLEKWLQIAPHDPRAHEAMLHALATRGRIRDAEDHVAATIRSFEREGLDWSGLRSIWQKVRAEASDAVRVESPPHEARRVEPAPDAARTEEWS